MLSRKTLALASLCTIVCTPAGLAEEAFKSSKFLQYAPDAQKSYINTSVVMASLIASQNSRKQADCLNAWIGSNVGTGYQPVLDAMKRFPDHHPSGVVLAVLQKACGALKYAGG